MFFNGPLLSKISAVKAYDKESVLSLSCRAWVYNNLKD